MARGDLDMYRVRLIEDATANVSDERIGEVEHQLLEQVLAPLRSGKTGLTRSRLTNAANRIIARLDPAGVRAKREKARVDRFVGVGAAEDGVCRILGSIPAGQGRAFDARLRELANTVCPNDLRTYEQRRADGLSALIDGAGFVHCECGRVDCGQGSRIATTARKPLVHLIMLDATLAGGDEPAYLDGYGIVDAAHAREIAGRRGSRTGAGTELCVRPRTVPAPCSTPGCGCSPAGANGCTAMWRPGTRTSIIIGRSTTPIPRPEVQTVAGNVTAYCRNHQPAQTFRSLEGDR